MGIIKGGRIVEAIKPYVPEPVPLTPDNLVRYLDQELMRIAETIQPLADTFNPEISGAMINPQGAFTIGLSRTPITNYEYEVHSESFGYEAINIDYLNGKYIFNMPDSESILVRFTGSIGIQLDASMEHNQTLFLEMDDGIGGSVFLAVAEIVTQKQDYLMLTGSRYIELPGVCEIGLSLRLSETAGTPIDITGDYELKFIDNHAEVDL